MDGGNWKELVMAACAGDLELVRYHVKNWSAQRITGASAHRIGNASLVGGWRFAPACCAAQSVCRAARKGAPQVRITWAVQTVAIKSAHCKGHPGLRAPPRQCSITPPPPLRSTPNMLPNHSLNRTHCSMRLKARHFILGL